MRPAGPLTRDLNHEDPGPWRRDPHHGATRERGLLAGVSGCSRLWSAVCGEYARKLSGGLAFSLVTGLPPVVCKSIAKASKVRILHLPPRAERALDLRKRRSGALFM